jgi:hypothetical protein
MPAPQSYPQLANRRCAAPPSRAIVEAEVVAVGAKDVLGKEGEQAAVSYLEGCGFRILDRNWVRPLPAPDLRAEEERLITTWELRT